MESFLEDNKRVSSVQFSCSVMSNSLLPHQTSLSLGFSWQEYWNVLPCTPPGDLPEPGIKPASPAAFALAGKFFTMGHHSMQKQQTLTNYHLCTSAVSHTMSMAM